MIGQVGNNGGNHVQEVVDVDVQDDGDDDDETAPHCWLLQLL